MEMIKGKGYSAKPFCFEDKNKIKQTKNEVISGRELGLVQCSY